MKAFIIKFSLAFVLLVAILMSALYFVPNPVLQASMLAAIPDKNKILASIGSPKIVLLGGSNVSFGFDTEQIQEQLHMPAYNMGMLGSVGLDYMMKQTLPYIHEGDVVVIIPEYANFNSNMYFGKYYLAAVLFDIAPHSRKDVTFAQWNALMPSVSKYAASKVVGLPMFAKQSLSKKPAMKGIHARDCFNPFGDNDKHWDLEPRAITAEPANASHNVLSDESFAGIKEICEAIEARGAKVMLLPPSYYSGSFDNQSAAIKEIAKKLDAMGTPFYSAPERYRLPVDLFFDTDYHLNKKGVDLRTALVIEDIRQFLQEAK